jgi:galactokinase
MEQKKSAPHPFTVIAPGRVNLLGEHVDYNDGPVLPVAIDRTLTLDITPLETNLIELHALDLGQTCTFRLSELAQKIDVTGQPLPRFALYPAGIAWALQRAGYPVHGLRAAYRSQIPMGSGLSSSAAVEVGFAQAFIALADREVDLMTLAQLAQEGENQYVGVHSGIMDQFACLFGQEQHALYLDTRSLAWEPVPLPPDVAIVVADSQVPRELAGSAYNDRRQACQQAVHVLQTNLPVIKSLRDVTVGDFNQFANTLPAVVRKRARHVVEEIARVEESVILLKQGDVSGFGALMAAGHESLRDLYEVSTPELDALVEIALRQPGCYGARLTGAGFGGCTVNLVREANVTDFMASLSREYQERTGKEAKLYHCHAARGAHIL